MRNKKNELDVDTIGDPDKPLTEEEKKALNDYFNSKKAKATKLHSVQKKTCCKTREIVGINGITIVCLAW